MNSEAKQLNNLIEAISNSVVERKLNSKYLVSRMAVVVNEYDPETNSASVLFPTDINTPTQYKYPNRTGRKSLKGTIWKGAEISVPGDKVYLVYQTSNISQGWLESNSPLNPSEGDTNTTYAFATGDSYGQIKVIPSDTEVAQNVTISNILPNQISTADMGVSGGLDLITSAKIGSAVSNKTFGLPAENITIEYSRDGGETWTDYGASDSAKISLFSEIRYSHYLGKASAAADNSVNNQLRITIIPDGRYVRFSGVYVWFSTNGNTCTFDLLSSPASDPTNFNVTIFSNETIAGWAGNNIKYFSGDYRFGGNSNRYAYRLIFKQTAVSSTRASANVMDIRFLGNEAWTPLNNMVASNHLYSWDSSFNATFPAQITATTFNGNLNGAASRLGVTADSHPSSGTAVKYPIYVGSSATASSYIVNSLSSYRLEFSSNYTLLSVGNANQYMGYLRMWHNGGANYSQLRPNVTAPTSSVSIQMPTASGTMARLEDITGKYQLVNNGGRTYNPNISAYASSSGSNKYARICLPAASFLMLYMEVSVRYNYNSSAGSRGGKLIINGWHNANSPYVWQSLNATPVGNFPTGVAVYGSDGGYIYILINSTYSNISVDKILIGDTAYTNDYSNATLDFVDSLPSGFINATMMSQIRTRTDTRPTSSQDLYPVFVKGEDSDVGAGSKQPYVDASALVLTQNPAYSVLRIGQNGNYRGYLRLSDNASSYHGQIYPATLTASRSYELPDKAGTFAMTSDVDTKVSKSGDTMTGNLTGVDFIGNSYLVEHADSTGTGNRWAKIKINSTETWMLAFTVRVYSSYVERQFRFSGYNYASTKTWHQPKVTEISSSDNTSITVVFGKDGDNDLWVAVPIGQYSGVVVDDVVNGYTQVSPKGLFTITVLTSKPSGTDVLAQQTAQLATNVDFTAANPSSETVRNILFTSNPAGDTGGILVDSQAGLQYNQRQGTTSQTGYSILKIGNNITSGTAGNSKGYLRLYDTTAYRAQIQTTTLTADRTITIPNAGGTIALTSQLPSRATASNVITKSSGVATCESSTAVKYGNTVTIYATFKSSSQISWTQAGTNGFVGTLAEAYRPTTGAVSVVSYYGGYVLGLRIQTDGTVHLRNCNGTNVGITPSNGIDFSLTYVI